jgi:hypothetical protein
MNITNYFEVGGDPNKVVKVSTSKYMPLKVRTTAILCGRKVIDGQNYVEANLRDPYVFIDHPNLKRATQQALQRAHNGCLEQLQKNMKEKYDIDFIIK